MADTGTDTVALFVQGPRVGVGVGWALGSFGLFSQWQKGLPDSLRRFRLSSVTPCSDLGIPADDTIRLRLVIRERPDAYNVHFPVYVSWTPLVRTRFHLTTQASALVAWKTYLQALDPDSLSYTLDISHRLSFGSLSLGGLLQYALAPQWFSIDNVHATLFTAGAAVHPLTVLYQRTSLSGSGSLPDSLQGLSSVLEAAVRNVYHDVTAFGFGISWQIGITTLAMATAGKGIMFGIAYEGQWFGEFYENGTRVGAGRISAAASNHDTPLSSLSHRFIVQVQVVRGKGGAGRGASQKSTSRGPAG